MLSVEICLFPAPIPYLPSFGKKNNNLANIYDKERPIYAQPRYYLQAPGDFKSLFAS